MVSRNHAFPIYPPPWRGGIGGATEIPLVIDAAQSRIEIAVKATMDSFVGRLNACEPGITVDDSGRIMKARVSFHFRDVVTGKERRDRAMHEWQHTEEHTDGLFVMTMLEPASEAAATVFGRLTFHGVTRDIRFAIAISREGLRCTIDGEVPIDTREFGLPKIRMLGLLMVDPIVHVRFHIQGVRDGGAAIRS